MPNQVPHPVRKLHSAQMRAMIGGSELVYRSSHLGKTLPVLWETATRMGPEAWDMQGLTDNYLKVSARAPSKLWNTISDVTLTGLTEEGLYGEISTG